MQPSCKESVFGFRNFFFFFFKNPATPEIPPLPLPPPFPIPLDNQHYRLMHWRYGAEQINYRRFFDVNLLAGVAVERENVFDKTHATLLRLVREGTIQRSEEHTSELQSQSNLVCRLLLEKKKK